MKTTRFAALVGSIALASSLAGCFGPPSTPAPSSASATAIPSPTMTQTPTPSATHAPSPAPSAEAPGQLPEQTAPLTLYYIALNDGGVSGPAVGCGDSAVATFTEPVTFRDQVQPAMTRLLANKSEAIGQSGLVNTLHSSNLTYQGGSFDGTTITVYLTGSFSLGGVCDIPRVRAQLEFTAIAAAGAQRADVFVNGRPLADVLSLK